MNIFNKIGILGIGIVSGIALCIAIFIYTDRFTVPQVSVTIVNNSDYDIREIKITYNTGYLVYNELSKNAQLILPVYMQGEGAYSIKVMLENGATLEGGVGYVESGYATREIVFNDKIESRNVSPY